MASIRIRVTRTGNPESLDVYIKTIERAFAQKVLEDDFKKIKNSVLDTAERIINTKRKRSLKRHNVENNYNYLTQLYNLINVLREGTDIQPKRSNRIRLGIGKLNFLQEKAPYWYVLNYGRRYDTGALYIPPSRIGYFGRGTAPGQGAEEVFHRTRINNYPGNSKGGKRVWLMRPQKAIEGIGYLEAMARTLEEEINKLVIIYKKRMKDAIKEAKGVKKEEKEVLSEFQLLEIEKINKMMREFRESK